MLLMLFLLGMSVGVKLYIFVRLHRLDPWEIPAFLIYSFITFRYARLIYRRLGG